MRNLIFRDDDTSYFTQIDQLEAIYGRIWEVGKSVSLAVVPNVYGDIRVYWRDGNPYDPGVPPQYRGKTEYYSILDNPELCAFLYNKAQAGLVEICLHGYAHIFYEFISHDQTLIGRMIDDGLEILNHAFPNITINTFIAPYDRLSPTAMTELLNRGFTISTQSTNLRPLPHLPQITGHDYVELDDSQLIYVCDNYFFTHRDDPHESLMNAGKCLALNDLTIVTNHYWMFFYDWNTIPNTDIMTKWNKFLDNVLTDDTVQIVSFNQNNLLDNN